MQTQIVLGGIELRKFIGISEFADPVSKSPQHSVIALYKDTDGLHVSSHSDYAIAESNLLPVSENIGRHRAFFNLDFVKDVKHLTRLKKHHKQEFTLNLDHEEKVWSIDGDKTGSLEWVDYPIVDELFGPNRVIYPILGPFKPSLLKSLAVINETMGYLDEAWIIGTTMEPGEDQRILDEYGRHRATRMTAVRKDWRALVTARFRTGANNPENETAMGYSVSKS